MKTPLERFEAKYTAVENGCWLWCASKDQNGYGMFYLAPHVTKASRASWVLYRGEIPEGMFVCHKCDTPSCVNPDHLFLGTQSDNMNDCIAKGRNVPCHGSRNGRSLLSVSDVHAIRELAKSHTIRHIATLYPVSSQQISDIVNRKKWRHI